MSEENDKNRVNIADLPEPTEELSSEDVKKVRGGGIADSVSTAEATGGAGAGKIKFNEFTIKKTSDT